MLDDNGSVLNLVQLDLEILRAVPRALNILEISSNKDYHFDAGS